MVGRSRRLQRAFHLVDAASSITPASLRADWRDEWRAELQAWADEGREGLVRHALGAFVDAAWLRQRQVVDASWVDDLRHGWRQLCAHAGFATMAVSVLAIGMAASITAFSVVSQILLRQLPYPEPDGVVTLWERRPGTPGRLEVAPGNFLDWRARATSFQFLAGVEPYSRDFTDTARPEVWQALNVTHGFFESLGVQPLLGRWFTTEEYAKGRHRVAVISAPLWRSRFGADPNVLGRQITLDSEPWAIVGVMPDEFFPRLLEERPAQILAWTPKTVEDFESRIRGGGYWQVVGRLAPGRTLDSARAEMERIAAQLETEQPRTNRESRVEVTTLREHLVGDVRAAIGLFAVAVIVVLLIACVNVTNLLLARGAGRLQELVVRSALGASRRRLVGQLLVENLLISGVAAIAALAGAAGAIRALARFGPPQVLWLDTLHVDWRAVAFAAGLSVVVALLAGIVPALRLSSVGHGAATRTSTVDIGHRRLRSSLVVAEVALALVLVVGAALLLRSFVNLLNVDTGFARANVAVLQLFAWNRNPKPDQLRTFFDTALRRVSALPGVNTAGAVMAMPFIEANIDVQMTFTIVGDPAPAPGQEPRASLNRATPGYFRTMGVALLAGRQLDDHDDANRPPVAVISEALAARSFRGRDPVGRRLSIGPRDQQVEFEIVGVVASARHERLNAAPRAEIFRPFAQSPSGSMTIVARTAADAQALVESIKREVWTVDPLQTFYRTATLDELVTRSVATRHFALLILVAFAVLALVLSAAGLYSVLSTIASQQRREIGVRLALGATSLDVVQLLLRRALTIVAIGIAIGVAGALSAGRLLTAFLFGVSPLDPWTMSGTVALMLLVALPACLLPANRAAAMRPVDVLRAD